MYEENTLLVPQFRFTLVIKIHGCYETLSCYSHNHYLILHRERRFIFDSPKVIEIYHARFKISLGEQMSVLSHN